jgi:hypothetical protein
VAHSVYDHAIGLLDLKQHSVISDPQSVFGRKGRQAFYIARKIIFQFLQRLNDPCRVGFGDSTQILRGTRLQFNSVSHETIVPSRVIFFKEASGARLERRGSAAEPPDSPALHEVIGNGLKGCARSCTLTPVEIGLRGESPVGGAVTKRETYGRQPGQAAPLETGHASLC